MAQSEKMAGVDPRDIQSAELVLGCEDLAASLQFYVEQLGFRLDAIFPADLPRVAVISGHGIRIRLDRDADTAPGTLRLLFRDARPGDGGVDNVGERVSPDGTRIHFTRADSSIEMAPLAPTVIVQRADARSWRTGRAGMQYRDLIPDRLGGRYIASHIRIPNGGPVPDYVHHHGVQFQMIYCHRGWVRVVYEDQGPAFKMQAGDCVLQPPHIRHRVLEASDGMEVIEICCPAEHQTLVDHEMALPTRSLRPDREFEDQHFVFHQSVNSTWKAGPYDGFESTDTGIRTATRGLASARGLRPTHGARACGVEQDAEYLFNFVLQGSVTLDCPSDGSWSLAPGDAFVMPAGRSFSFAAVSTDLELLQVSLNQTSAPRF